jgi:hypothetical protein
LFNCALFRDFVKIQKLQTPKKEYIHEEQSIRFHNIQGYKRTQVANDRLLQAERSKAEQFDEERL